LVDPASQLAASDHSAVSAREASPAFADHFIDESPVAFETFSSSTSIRTGLELPTDLTGLACGRIARNLLADGEGAGVPVLGVIESPHTRE
jgi:hypothetical protein